MSRPSSNSIIAIKPYRWNGLWVFDDPAVGLLREPFVSGMPEIIDRAVAGLMEAESGFLALFSASPFPAAAIVFEKVREESGGTWYRWKETGQEGWLCPALFRYFESPPDRIYVQIRPAAFPLSTV